MQVTKFFRNFAIKLNKMGQKEEKEKIKTARETLGRYFYDLSKTSFGTGLLGTFLPYFTKGQSLLLVHNVTTSEDDIEFIKLQTENAKLQTSFCLCPNANLYITRQLPNVQMLVDKRCNIVLGTDSLASNHQLSILEEMKTLQQHFPQLKLADVLQWATINGARALQMDDTLGSFEKGKQPGIVLIESVENGQLNEASSSVRIL